MNRASGNRLKRQMVDSVTGDVIENDEEVKGYAVAKDEYVVVEDDELAEIAIESSHTVDIERFVPKASIDDRYRDKPYYLAPEDKVSSAHIDREAQPMALKRAPGTPRPDLNHIAFPMEDVATGKVVSCMVSEDALRKLSGGGSSIASMEAMFEQHRDEVEGIASNKYDVGQSSPLVLEDDV